MYGKNQLLFFTFLVTTINIRITLCSLSIWFLTATGNNINSFFLFYRPSVGACPPHLQCERDLCKPGVEPAPQLRRAPGLDIQRGV